MNASQNTIPFSAVIDVHTVAKFIGVSESKIRQWIREKRIPYIQLDGRIVFLITEIIEWLKSKQVTPSADKISSEESSAVISNKLWHKAINN